MATVKVAVRVRPFNQRELDMGCEKIVDMEGKKTRIINTKIAPSNLEGDIGRERVKEFAFDFSHCSFDHKDITYASQEQVFSDLGTDVVDNAFEGYNACVFAYGQTGSGKTYTMMGSPDCAGLIPRICQNLFERMKKDKDAGTTYRTEVSYLEIYNEKVKDLLKQGSDHHNLRVREHPRYGPYVEDLSKHLVMDYSDIYELMMKGNSIRTTASTNMNDVSSRSHAIFTITFVQAKFSRDAPSETVSKVNLVDLAGSERADASGATGQRLKEGGHINKSLVTLGSVISALADLSSASSRGRTVFIPYRDSVLTWLLKDSLGGNSKTVMIAAISPADVNYGETLSTLRYANRAKNIVNKPTINEDPNVRLIRDLRSEIAHLRSMLGNEPKVIDSNQMVMKLHANEAKVRILTEEWAERWRETQKILQEQQTLALRKSGVGVVLDSDRPHLVGLDDSVFSTGITFYPLKEGQTLIGGEDSSEEQDIVLTGEDLQAEHCIVELSTNGDAVLIPLEQASCYIDTVRVEKPTKLDHGCVILLGRNNMFRFNDPAEAAKLRKEKERGSSLNLSRLSFLSWSTPDLAKPIENDGARLRRCFEEAEADSLKAKKTKTFKGDAKPSKLLELGIESTQQPDNKSASCTLEEVETETLKEDNSQAEAEISPHLQLEQNLFDQEKESVVSVTITPESQEQVEEPKQILDKAAIENIDCCNQNETVEVEDKEPQDQNIDAALLCLEQERLRLTETFHTKMEELQTRLKVLDEQEELLQQSSAFQLTELQREQELLQQERKNEIMKMQKVTKDADLLRMELFSLQQYLADAEVDLSTEATVLNRETLLKNVTSYQQVVTGKIQDLQKEILGTSTQLDAQLQAFQNEEMKLESRLSTTMDDDVDEKLTIEIELSSLRKEKDKLCQKLTEQQDQNQVKLKELNLELAMLDKKHNLLQSYVTCSVEDKNEILDDIRSRIDDKQNALSGSFKKIADTEFSIANIDTEQQRSRNMLHQKADEITRDKRELEQLINLQIKLNKEATAELDLRRSALEKNSGMVLSHTGQTLHRLPENLNFSSVSTPALATSCDKLGCLKSEGSSLLDHSSPCSRNLRSDFPLQLEEIALSPIEPTLSDLGLQNDDITSARSPNSYNAIKKVEDYVSHFSSDMLRSSTNETLWKDVDRRILELQHLQEQYCKLEEELGTTGTPDLPSPEKTQSCSFLCKRLFEEEKLDRLLGNDNHHQTNSQSSQSGSSSPSRSSRASRSPSISTRDLLSPSRTRSPVGQFEEVCEGVYIAVPSFVMRGSGAAAHFEYEIKVVVMRERWTIFRRYKRIRELHLQMRQKYGAKVTALNFPSRKIFGSNSEKNAEERRQQLQVYFQKLLSLCLSLKECPLYAAESLSKQVLCDVIPFFRKGSFETSKWATG